MRRRARAYELIEALQVSPGCESLDSPLAQAQARGWWDIVFLLRYAQFAQRQRSGLDCAQSISRLFELAERTQDTVLLALALATRAEQAVIDADHSIAEMVESDLARAVALLAEDDGAGIDAPTAYIACGLAYHERGLWELAEEMYQQAGRLVEVSLPAPLDRTQRTVRQVLPYNRREVLLGWSCALVEIDDRDAAADLARRALALPVDVAGLPEAWVDEIAGIDYALAAIAGRPRPVPVDVVLAQVESLAWTPALGCLWLAEAIRAHDAGDRDAAALLAERAETSFGGHMANVRLLALRLRAEQPPAHEEALRYGRELARMRWQTRLRMLGSARARIEGARIVLEHDRLTQHAYVDQLTGLANRHAYSRYLERLRNADADHRVAVLMVDVDHFKNVNDLYGHAVGDHVLRRIADALTEGARATDLVARLGGDEFVVLLDAVGLPVAVGRAHELLQAMARCPWSEITDGLSVSVSIGLAAGAAADIDDLLEAADKNLYEVKKSTRGTLKHP